MKRLLRDVATSMLALAAVFSSTSLRGLSGLSMRLMFLFILAMTVLYFPSITKNLRKPDHRIQLGILLSCLLLFIFKLSLGQPYLKDIFGFIVYPLLLSFIFEQMSSDSRLFLRRAVLVFFVLECTVAILERILQVNFFAPERLLEMIEFYNTGEMYSFRSTAFIDNPLTNAFVVATGMAFIALDKTIPVRDRVLLGLLGFIALLCFNGRAAIIVVSLLVLPYLLVEYYKEHHFNIFAFSLSLVALLVLWRILTTTSMGGRLFHNSLADGSTQARILALTFKRYITDFEMWTGAPFLYDRVKEALDTGGVENGVVCWILKYGLLFTMLILPLLMIFHWQKLGVYSRKWERWLILLVFYLIGTSNPNLAQASGWVYWVLFYYAFSPGSYVPRHKLSAEDYLRRRYRSIAT